MIEADIPSGPSERKYWRAQVVGDALGRELVSVLEAILTWTSCRMGCMRDSDCSLEQASGGPVTGEMRFVDSFHSDPVVDERLGEVRNLGMQEVGRSSGLSGSGSGAGGSGDAAGIELGTDRYAVLRTAVPQFAGPPGPAHM